MKKTIVVCPESCTNHHCCPIRGFKPRGVDLYPAVELARILSAKEQDFDCEAGKQVTLKSVPLMVTVGIGLVRECFTCFLFKQEKKAVQPEEKKKPGPKKDKENDG